MKELSNGWFLFYFQYRKSNTRHTNHRRKTIMNIKDRIAKLLALAESPNEHEAKPSSHPTTAAVLTAPTRKVPKR